jgi:protein SCO1/2
VAAVTPRAIATLFLVGLIALAAAIVGLRGVLHERDSESESPGPAAVVHGPASPFKGAPLPEGVRAPDFSLRDENGRRVTMREYRGKTVIVTFLYSHCKTECPAQALQIKGALDDLGRDVPALAVSVDPPGDTPGSIKRFNRKMGVSGRIRWVRGSEGQLRKLWKGFAIVPQTPRQEHLARIVLIDRDGVQRVGFPASQVTPERLAHDLRVLERS